MRRKQQIWDDQYQKHHDNLANLKGRYEASFIFQETLGPRPETPLLDDIAMPEQLQKLEVEKRRNRRCTKKSIESTRRLACKSQP